MTTNSSDETATDISDQAKRNQEITSALGKRSVVLVGMMGCGKSAIGRLVASALELAFHDADTEIETAAGMSIPEIFTTYGEKEFRRGEERVIKRLVAKGPLVLALGGGAFLSAETRAEIEANGLSIWLKADADLLLSRVMRRPGNRPLLQTPDPRKTLLDLLETRSPVYALADLHVTSSRSSKTRTRDSLLKALHHHLVERPQ